MVEKKEVFGTPGSSYAVPSVLHVLCNTLVGAYVSL